jgi:hypothetical protein
LAERNATRDVWIGRRLLQEGLPDKARTRWQEVIENYPDTEAAKDAQALLDGENPKPRPLQDMPKPPLLEDYFLANQGEFVEAAGNEADAGLNAAGSASSGKQRAASARPSTVTSTVVNGQKTVHVNGYINKNGKFVQGYWAGDRK